MARPREFDTDQTIQQIATKFWADGYEATGITDLEETTGLARASLYAAFGPKQAMLHQSIDWYLDNRIEPMAMAVDDSGLEGAAGWFRTFARVRRAKPEEAQMGCLMVNSVVELGGEDAGVVDRAERYRTRVHDAFRSALAKAVEDGEMEHGLVEVRADHCYLMLMGMFVAIKSRASVEEIEALCDVAVSVIESWRVPVTV